MTALEFYERVYGPVVLAFAQIEQAGIRVDTKYGERLATELRMKCDALAKEAAGIAAGLGVQSFKPTEKDKVADIVFGRLGLPAGRMTPKKGRPSVEAVALRPFRGKHRFVDLILDHDRHFKALSTNVEKYILPVDKGGWLWPDGKLHSNFHLDLARSGRSSSDNPNIQNIPIRDRELAPRIRRMLIPTHPKGEFVELDEKAFELRVSAMYTGDRAFTDVFRRDGNPHAEFAVVLTGKPLAQVTNGSKEYAAAKGSNFQLIYGGSAFGLRMVLEQEYGIKLTEQEAARIVRAFFKLHPETAAYLEEAKRLVLEQGWVESLTGRRRAIPPPPPDATGYEREHPFHVAANTRVQGTAWDLMLGAILEFYRAMKKYKLKSRQNNAVHDNGWFDVWPGERSAVLELAHTAMTKLDHLFDFITVPLDVEVKAGPTMGDMEKISLAA